MLQRLWLADLDPTGASSREGRASSARTPGTSPAASRRTSATWPRSCMRLGHEVVVLAPGRRRTPLPAVRRAGRAGRAGAVQRLGGPAVTSARCRRPGRVAGSGRATSTSCTCTSRCRRACRCSPCWAAPGPIVATFHSSYLSRSRAYGASYGILQPTLERITARIAVSEAARRHRSSSTSAATPCSSPTGCDCAAYATADPLPGWPGHGRHARCSSAASTSRARGCRCCSRRCPPSWPSIPGVRLLVAGPGDVDEVRDRHRPGPARPGRVPRPGERARTRPRMLHSVDLYVAPNTGGRELRDHPARGDGRGRAGAGQRPRGVPAVLDDGRAGRLFPVGDAGDLAAAADRAARRPARSGRRWPRRGTAVARRYDWQTVAQQVLAVYETVILPGIQVGEDPRAQAFGLFSTRLKDDQLMTTRWVLGALLLALALLGLYLRGLAGRLDRLHVRVEAASQRARRAAGPSVGRRPRAGDVRPPRPGQQHAAGGVRARGAGRRPGDARGGRERAVPGPAGHPGRPGGGRRAALDRDRAGAGRGARRRPASGWCWPAGSTTTPPLPPFGSAGTGWCGTCTWPGGAPLPVTFECDDRPPACLSAPA